MAHAGDWITDFCAREIKEILFIPYAGVTLDWDAYTEKVEGFFSTLGLTIKSIHQKPDPVKAVQNAQMIAVGGGNTFQLLNLLYQHKLMDPIVEAVKAGTPIIGWSAGSNIAGPSIRTTNDMPIVEPPSFDALNLLDFQINPHYTEAALANHGGETRAERLAEFLELNPGLKVLALPEGTALLWQDDGLKLLGESMTVFEKGKEPVRLNGVLDLK